MCHVLRTGAGAPKARHAKPSNARQRRRGAPEVFHDVLVRALVLVTAHVEPDRESLDLHHAQRLLIPVAEGDLQEELHLVQRRPKVRFRRIFEFIVPKMLPEVLLGGAQKIKVEARIAREQDGVAVDVSDERRAEIRLELLKHDQVGAMVVARVHEALLLLSVEPVGPVKTVFLLIRCARPPHKRVQQDVRHVRSREQGEDRRKV